jgi:porphobilinogen synthase
MPGVFRYGADRLEPLAHSLAQERITAVLLFGIPRRKDAIGSEADSPRSAVVTALKAFRRAAPDIVRFTDVCLCAYTDHGHCGVVRGGRVDNDASVRRLVSVALAHAEAGADFVAPSAMMDHQVLTIRDALDRSGQDEVGILAYAAKFASTFYGPFRDAEGSTPAFGDRRSYQVDPRNAREALAELLRDAEEGADVLMVKPALPCLDVIARARRRIDRPLAAYQVSGEYAMIKAAAERGWLDESAAIRESLIAIRRAGADLIVTYFARAFAQAVAEER